jgi:hypothetical protein
MLLFIDIAQKGLVREVGGIPSDVSPDNNKILTLVLLLSDHVPNP